MTQHLCSTHDPTCYRCELRQDEYRRGMEEEVTELRALADAAVAAIAAVSDREVCDRLMAAVHGYLGDAHLPDLAKEGDDR
jgi:hypothetical protein